MPYSSLDILLLRFKEAILDLGFEVSEDGFNQMKESALDYCRLIRQGENPDKRCKRTYALYCSMIKLEGETDFLEGRYSEY